MYGQNVEQHTFQDIPGFAKELAKPAEVLLETVVRLKSADKRGKCGLGELVHEPLGAHDVQGDVPYSIP